MSEHAQVGCGLPARAAIRGLAVLALAAPGCSLALDFSGGADPIDAGVPDASPLEACDTLEPNDEIAEAQPIEPGAHALGLCDGDEADFFAFDLESGDDLTIAITFEFEDGRRDLELRLYDLDAGTEIDTASSSGGETRLERTTAAGNALAAGAYAVEVSMSATVTDPAADSLYDLDISY